ncbi:MAG: hypothetical protein KF739_08810 [Cryobacterium sp.]|nr:hypothetical protein [Cryobacterium sp.]
MKFRPTEQIGRKVRLSQQYIAIAVWYDNHDLRSFMKHFTSGSSKSAITP